MRASFAAHDAHAHAHDVVVVVEFVVEISRCRAPLHRSTTEAVRHAVDVELYSSTLLYSAPERSTSLQLYTGLVRLGAAVSRLSAVWTGSRQLHARPG